MVPAYGAIQAANARHAPDELIGWTFSFLLPLAGDRPSGKRPVGPKVASADKTSPCTTSSHHRLGAVRRLSGPAASSCRVGAQMTGRGDMKDVVITIGEGGD